MNDKRWDIESLIAALSTSDEARKAGIGITVPEGMKSAALVSLEDRPGLEIVAAVDGGEIQFGVLLERVASVPDASEFDRHLLKANKLMTLTTFGVTEVGGEEWYEAFGQMSSASRLEEVIEEVLALGNNAEEALETIVEWQKERA